MTFIPAVNTVQVAMIYLQSNQRIQNVFNVVFDEPPDISAVTTLAEDFLAWWETNIKNNQSNEVALQAIDLTVLTTQNDLAITYTTGLPQTGGYSATKASPNNVTVAVKWSSTLRGRSYRGRTYHIGLADGYLVGSNLNSGIHTALVAGYGALITTINVTGRHLCVVSYHTNNAPRSTAVMTIISSVSIDTSLDSQRRRLPGRGE